MKCLFVLHVPREATPIENEHVNALIETDNVKVALCNVLETIIATNKLGEGSRQDVILFT